MISALCMLLMTGFMPGGPDSPWGYFGYILAILPFFWDLLISMWTVNKTMNRSGGATVEEIPVNEEHFMSMNNVDNSRDA